MTDRSSAPRRVHPVTPLVKVGTALPIVFLVIVGTGVNGFLQGGGGAWAALALLVVIALVLVGWEFVQYRRFTYWFDDDGDLRVNSGLVFQQERRLQLSRLQTVDVVRPLLARVVGMAAVTIEVAGAGDSKAEIRYLTMDDATALRAEVIARAAGLERDVGEAPERPLIQVPTGDLITSLVLRVSTLMLLGLTVVVFVGTVWAEGPAGLGALLIGGLPIFMVFSEFTQLFNFTVAESPDGLRLRYGLLQTKSVTIPPGRVCAVEFVEPLLWRRRGWVRLQVTVAGATRSDDEAGTESVLLPVAPREVAESLFRRVMPTAQIDVELVSAPAVAGRRSPIQWRHLAAGWGEHAAVLRRGRVTRRLQVVDHARVQSVRLTQGPWERRFGLASVHLDLPPGRIDAVALHFPLSAAHAMVAREVVLARSARADDRSTRWMDQP